MNQSDGSEGHSWLLASSLEETKEGETGGLEAATAAKLREVVELETGMAMEAGTPAVVARMEVIAHYAPIPGGYLHSGFVVQDDISTGDVWIADSGASCHMMRNNANMYNIRPPPPGREVITIGDKCELRVEYVGSKDVDFHGYLDE